MTIFRCDRFGALAVLTLLGACAAGAQDGAAEANAAMEDVASNTVVTVTLGEGPTGAAESRLRAMGPRGWHRLALHANWDFVTTETWRWIASQPDCDRATALAIFWRTQPDYYLQYASSAEAGGDRAEYDLITLIRDRWVAGGYKHAVYAYDPDADLVRSHVDLTALRKRFGARVDRMIPPSMWPAIAGPDVPDDGLAPEQLQ